MNRFFVVLVCACLALAGNIAYAKKGGASPKGLNTDAIEELQDAGVDKYVGEFTPVASEEIGDGWIKHTFDPDGGNGPICIAGTPYSVFTKAQNPANVLIMLQGGGACWQDFYFCNVLSEDQEPPAPPVGIWDFDNKMNPVGNWSVVYMPYCDGSVFSGDNDVFDPAFGAAIGVPQAVFRFHRGLRNVTAGIDLAKAAFPRASRILVAGSSAGGVGAASWAPFLARMAYGNNKKLMVFNDAGPIAVNLLNVPAATARQNDWRFDEFYPASCEECDAFKQGTEIVKWRLRNDSTIRESFYSTDGDATNRFFASVPSQALYRTLILSEHGPINAEFPDRYKTFIRSGDDSHTALQTPLLYNGLANGVPLYQWLSDSLVPRPAWMNIVEDFVPLP